MHKAAFRKSTVRFKFPAAPYLYLLPTMLLMGTFVYYPFVKTIYLSLGLTNARGLFVEYVGLENYIRLFTSPSFFNSLKVTCQFVLFGTLSVILLSFGLAMLTYRPIPGRKVFRVSFAMPMAIASAPAAIIWSILLHPSMGHLNYWLHTDIKWLLDEKWALIAVTTCSIWLNLGMNYIFLTAGLRNLPSEVLESASIDGASAWKKFLYMIVPLMSPTLFFVLVINVIQGFQVFGEIHVLTAGGPGEATNVLVHSIFNNAFVNYRFETACAQSVILFLIMLGFTLLQLKLERKGVHYE